MKRGFIWIAVLGLLGCQTNRDFRFVSAIKNSALSQASIDLTDFSTEKGIAFNHEFGSFDLFLKDLNAGKSDFIIFPNAVIGELDEYPNVRSVLPVYHAVGLILYRSHLQFESKQDLIRNNKTALINAKFFEHFFIDHNGNIPFDNITINSRTEIESMVLKKYDVIAVFVGLNSPYLQELLKSGEWKIFEEVDAQTAGKGTLIEGFCLRHSNFDPFLIPKNFYGSGPERAMQTVAVDYILLTNTFVDQDVVYDLKSMLLQNKQALAAKNTMFASMKEAQSVGDFIFPLHKGAISYINRNQPSFVERNAELIGLVVSLIVLFVGFVRRRNKSKKDRFDDYYSKVKNAESIAELEAIEKEVLELIMDEKLSGEILYANFLTLANQTRAQLKD